MGILVYFQDPYHVHYSDILKDHIYGCLMNMPPTEVPLEYWRHQQHCLQQVPYTKKWLESKFKTIFPNIIFTYSELKNLPYESLQDIGRAMGVAIGFHKHRRSLVFNIMEKLRRVK